MAFRFLLGFAFFITSITTVVADPLVFLDKCWEKQVAALEGKYLSVAYQEVNNRFYHSFEPWQKYTTTSSGVAYITGTSFYKLDSVVRPKATVVAKTQWAPEELLHVSHGDTTFAKVSKSDHLNELLETARLSPMPLIEYFHARRSSVTSDTFGVYATYTLTINKSLVTLSINKRGTLLQRISMLSHHRVLGDVLTTYEYGKFSTLRKLFAPRGITIEKMNGKIKEEVTINYRKVVETAEPLLTRPANFSWKPEPAETPEIAISKYNEHIHFIDLKHTDSKVMVVEFNDFLLVAEAPLTSENGELIIREAKKIAPNKPVKYFTFSHHHPHYIGGIRAFVQNGTTIITLPIVGDYVREIVSAKRTLQPDGLSKHPKDLILKQFTDSTTITDGSYEMKIYLLGKRSEHAIDFLVYYFPQEQMMFQGELVWIDKDKPLEKAGPRQAGLYHFIKDLGIPVKTIVQSWPLAQYNVRPIVAFDELERSVNVQ